MRQEQDDNEESLWTFDADGVIANIAPLMELWRQYKNGILPFAGGWLDQPLDILAQIMAVDLVVNTQQFAQSPDVDYSDLNITQMELLKWLAKE